MTVREHLLRQAGVISLDQARQAGLTYRQVQHKVQTGEWLAVRRGIYRLHAAAPLPETGLWVALLALGPQALLTEHGAIWLWEIEPQSPDSWMFAGTTSRRGDETVRLTRAFVDPRDQTRHRGIRVVSRPWAVLTTAARRERACPGSGIALIDHAKQTRAVRQEELDRSFARHPGCWGSATIRALLLRTGNGAHSELERLAVSILRDAGITGFDIAFVDRRIAIELDGYAFHSGASAFRRDLRRGNRLMKDGWTVRRFSWDDLLGDPESFLATIIQLLSA
jgi:hypothetical protein